MSMRNRLFPLSLGVVAALVAVYVSVSVGRSRQWQGARTESATSEPRVTTPADAREAAGFAQGLWINSEPLDLEGLRGRVVLVDFWTFGCYNCRNTLPSLKRLHETYAEKGLTIVGVHSPEFSREREPETVRAQVRSLGIEYPVVTDNDFKTWDAYDVHAWPTVVLLDKRGRVRYRHVGEGAYEQQERAVRELLAE